MSKILVIEDEKNLRSLYQQDFEREGFVADVVFPTGVVFRGETLAVYYGASDTFTGVAELSRQEVLNSLQPI